MLLLYKAFTVSCFYKFGMPFSFICKLSCPDFTDEQLARQPPSPPQHTYFHEVFLKKSSLIQRDITLLIHDIVSSLWDCFFGKRLARIELTSGDLVLTDMVNGGNCIACRLTVKSISTNFFAAYSMNCVYF